MEHANTDVLVFGNSASEAAHGAATGFSAVMATVAPVPSEPSLTPSSDVIQGNLGQSARRLLPRSPNGDYYGGEISFTMAVDPIRENNFTIKFWGSDASSSGLVLNVNGFEVGGRHLTNDESVLLYPQEGWFANRFIHRTVRLPFHLTRGQSSVTLKIRSLGRNAYYSTTAYDNYQKRMTSPTVPLYKAYMHTAAVPDVSAEPQGSAPVIMSAAGTTPEAEAAWLSSWKSTVNSQLNSKLAAAPARLTADDLDYLAQAYSVTWTTAYNQPAVASQVIAAFDGMVAAYSAAPGTYFGQTFADHGGNGGWGGYFGQVGSAITLLWPQLSGAMDTTVAYGGTLGTTTRRAAWASALRASVDFGRTHRRTISNQVIDAAHRIYFANAAALLVDTTRALNEAEARRYLHEAFGLSPWMGEDQAGGGPVPVRGLAPYGPNWFMTTSRGTTKEDCLVGGDYGEMGATGFLLGTRIGDPTLAAQGLKMLRARAALRYRTVDAGGKPVSYVAEPIGCRNDGQMTRHAFYLANNTDSVLVAGQGAAMIGTDLLGYVQQQFNEGQLLVDPASAANWYKGFAGWSAIVSVPGAYAAFKAQAATGVNLPMTSEQADFAWSDEENMVVAAKHGEDRFWANLNWRGPRGINRLARVFLTEADKAYIADVSVEDVRYTPSGRRVTLDGRVDLTPPHGMEPPDHPVGANGGVVQPIAIRPDLSTLPSTNRDAGRGSAYTLRYGRWLVAMNAHPTASYTVLLPFGTGGGKDLVSGVTHFGSITLGPKATAVFHTGRSTASAPRPAPPLMPGAVSGNTAVVLSWDAAPGAALYAIKRSMTSGGPYAEVTRVSGTAWTDTTVSNGSTYYYVISAVSPRSVMSRDSLEVAGTPLQSSLPAPMISVGIGAQAFAGSASYSSGVYTLSGSGADIWGAADAFQFAAAPMVGSGSITARVASEPNTNPWTKVGVMMRTGLAADSPHVMVLVTPGNGVRMAARRSSGDSTFHPAGIAGIKAPYWVRLTRSGNSFTGSISPDGLVWTTLASVAIDMPDGILAGMAVTSHDNTRLHTSTFDNVTLPAVP